MLRLLGWNALLLLVGVVLIAIAGEAYLRLTTPFVRSVNVWEFVPNVGMLRPPNMEIRSTNNLDFWNVSRTNSLGFLDREPPSPERAAATCHISMIGDSFVEAKEVPIRDKFHVLLEELAADELPHLDITTSAFGIEGTGQIQQLPFYDEYARLLHPKLIVLVFAPNDFRNNTPVLRALILPQDPRPRSPRAQPSRAARAMEKAMNHSWLVFLLHGKLNALFPDTKQAGRWSGLRHRQQHATYFALEQFRQRTDRDGARLVILASHRVTNHRTTPMFERLSQMAATLDIPVIGQADYILRQGARLSDAQWPHDGHWNPAGHRWAAEALLEYLEEHPATCDRPTGAAARLEPTF